jgi:tetratricopeptide (TPR) repeat protein
MDSTADSLNSAAWVCVRVPGVVADPQLPVKLAERALAKEPGDSNYLNTCGAALYRAGRFEDAVKRLQEAIKAEGAEGTVWDFFFLALAHHRLGNAAEARQWFDKAVRWIDQPPRDGDDPAKWSWGQRLDLQLLRREAERTLAPAPQPRK